MKSVSRVISGLAVVILLSGCVVVGGRQTVQKPTRGQELVDLKAAYDAGALDTEEYECKRADILRQ